MSECHSYNLLDEQWIPVVWRDDASAADPQPPKIGIRDALQRAREIRCVSHTSPFVEFGLYRLLITIVLDAYIVAERRPTIGRMKQMLEAGQFDNVVLEYLETYKKHFNLWDSEQPFLQPKAPNKIKAVSVANLVPALPSGANIVHWHHFTQERRNSDDPLECLVTEAEAAQWLTAVSPFTFKGKVGAARTLAGDPPMYALVLAESLFETIVLNLPRPSGRVTLKQEREVGPTWRTNPDIATIRVPSLAQGFTFPVRHIRLEYSEGGIEKSAYSVAFKRTAKTKINAPVFDARYGWRDPNAGTETTSNQISHIKARPGIPVWRDAIPLFLVASEGEPLCNQRRRSRPEVISNALRILGTPKFRVAVYGMRKKIDKGGDVKVEEWFRSVLTLPAEVARDSRLSARAIDAFKTTQRVAEALQTALRMLRAPSEAKKTAEKERHRNELDTLAEYWRSLEPALSRSYLEELNGNDSKAEEKLWNIVRKEAHDAFKHAAEPYRRTADGLFRIANASNWLERRLARLLPKPSREKGEESE